MKRKWYIGGLVPMLYSITRLVLTFLFFGIAWIKLNTSILDLFEAVSLLFGPPVLLSCCIIMFIIFKRILIDCDDPEKRSNYKFQKFPILILIKCVFDVLTFFIWEIGIVDLSNKIDAINGVSFAGHASGILFFPSLGFAALQMLLSIYIAVKFQRRYKEKVPAVD